MGRHRSRAHVFADQRGERAWAASLVLRSMTFLVVACVVAVGVSVMVGVSLPGVTAPAQPPPAERPVQHAEPTSSTPYAPSLLPMSPHPGLPARPASSVDPSPSGSPTPSESATPSASATSTHGNQPTGQSTSPSHGHGPPVTPPGRTKHP